MFRRLCIRNSLVQAQKEDFIIPTFEEIGTWVSDSTNTTFAITLVQLLPVLGIALVIEARWLIHSSWWILHSKSWQESRLFSMLFSLAWIFIAELSNLNFLSSGNYHSYQTDFGWIAVVTSLINLCWLPLEEIANTANLDRRHLSKEE